MRQLLLLLLYPYVRFYNYTVIVVNRFFLQLCGSDLKSQIELKVEAGKVEYLNIPQNEVGPRQIQFSLRLNHFGGLINIGAHY